MKSALTSLALVLVALVASVQPAQANIWDWMQEWSGPGPFTSNGKVWLSTFCLADFKGGSTDNARCYFVDVSYLDAEATKNFPASTTAHFFDFGVSWRLRRSIAVGVGAGLMTVHANDGAKKFTVTAPRILVEPVALGRELFAGHGSVKAVNWGDNPWWHVLKFYAEGRVIVGHLSGDKLGVPNTDYNRTNEFVMSRGLMVDLGEFVHPVYVKLKNR